MAKTEPRATPKDEVAALVRLHQQHLRDSRPLDSMSGTVTPAFDKLVNRVIPPLTGIAHKIVGNLDDAKDIAQESVIKLWEVLDESFEPRRVWPWLLTATKNGSIDEVRRRTCRLRFAADSQNEAVPAKYEDERFMDGEYAKQMLKEIRYTLPERLKDVFDLKGQDLKAKEIAETLGRPISTVHRNIKEIEMIALGMRLEAAGSNNAYERFVTGESAEQITDPVRATLPSSYRNVFDLKLQGLKAEAMAKKLRRPLYKVYHDLGEMCTIAKKIRQQNDESNNPEVSDG